MRKNNFNDLHLTFASTGLLCAYAITIITITKAIHVDIRELFRGIFKDCAQPLIASLTRIDFEMGVGTTLALAKTHIPIM